MYLNCVAHFSGFTLHTLNVYTLIWFQWTCGYFSKLKQITCNVINDALKWRFKVWENNPTNEFPLPRRWHPEAPIASPGDNPHQTIHYTNCSMTPQLIVAIICRTLSRVRPRGGEKALICRLDREPTLWDGVKQQSTGSAFGRSPRDFMISLLFFVAVPEIDVIIPISCVAMIYYTSS